MKPLLCIIGLHLLRSDRFTSPVWQFARPKIVAGRQACVRCRFVSDDGFREG